MKNGITPASEASGRLALVCVPQGMTRRARVVEAL